MIELMSLESGWLIIFSWNEVKDWKLVGKREFNVSENQADVVGVDLGVKNLATPRQWRNSGMKETFKTFNS